MHKLASKYNRLLSDLGAVDFCYGAVGSGIVKAAVVEIPNWLSFCWQQVDSHTARSLSCQKLCFVFRLQMSAHFGKSEKEGLQEALQQEGAPLLNFMLRQDEGAPHRMRHCAAVMMPRASASQASDESKMDCDTLGILMAAAAWILKQPWAAQLQPMITAIRTFQVSRSIIRGQIA